MGFQRDEDFREPAGTHINAADSLVERLRAYYFARDFEGGVVEGQKLLEEGYSPQLHAWYLINLARNRDALKATREAKKLVDEMPESVWSWFALAGTAYQLNAERLFALGEEVNEALTASTAALRIRPNDPDIQFIHSEVLRTQESPERALHFLDSLAAHESMTAPLFVSRAQALYNLSWDNSVSNPRAFVDSSFAAYAQARKLDSTHVDAYFLPGERLTRIRRTLEGESLLETALRLSPYSSSVRLGYGHAIYGQRTLEAEIKKERIRSTIEEALTLRPDSPEFLYIAAVLYFDINDAENRELVENRLLELEPEGPRTEWTLLRRIRQFGNEHEEAIYGEEKDPQLVRQYRDMLRDFSDRDWLIREDLLGEIYLKRFHAIDATISDDEALDIVRGMADYEKLNPRFAFHRGPVHLAERGAYFREAEHTAERGFEAFREYIEQFKNSYESVQEYQKALARSDWWGHDAIGWIYFNEGRLAEAEERLAAAYDLTEGNELDVLMHLGRLYEKRYDAAVQQQAGDAATITEALDGEALFITAFNYYKKAATTQTPYENPAEYALKALYTKRNGSAEGYEDFLAALEADDTEQRKMEVLAARLEQPEEIKPFELVDLDGNVYTHEDLTGKIAAINVWSTTCGPCLLEMPDLQALYEKYRDDPDVLILTITKDFNPGEARQWIQERGYSLPVLVDDGFLDEMDVRAYPLTWFLDSSGGIAYSKTGWSKYLVEEFSWRIEDLRSHSAFLDR